MLTAGEAILEVQTETTVFRRVNDDERSVAAMERTDGNGVEIDFCHMTDNVMTHQYHVISQG